MALTLPKIRVGRSTTSRQVMSKDHNISTSASWGFVQPLGLYPMIPNSTIKYGLKSFVRMASMPSPTFGNLSFRTYCCFVSLYDLYHPFEALLAGQTYTTSTTSYIPQSLPKMKLSDLCLTLFQFAAGVSFYVKDSSGKYKLVTNGSTASDLKTRLSIAFKPTYSGTTSFTGIFVGIPVYTSTSGPIVPDSADHILHFTDSQNNDAIACFLFGNNLKNLRKVLIGCGYQFSLRNGREVSLMPLFAYYKAWFDLFSPKRNISWTSTNLHKLLDEFRQNGTYSITMDNRVLFLNVMQDIYSCYYTVDPDYITSHINNAALPYPTTPQPHYSSASSLDDNRTLTRAGEYGMPQISSSSAITRIGLMMLNRFSKIINKNGVIRNQLKEILESRFGAKLQDNEYTDYIGSNVLDCAIDEITSTAATETHNLGDYAGYGEGGQKDYHRHEFTAKTFGYWITLGCVVPAAGYCQQNNSNGALYHLDKWSIFTPEFDAVGYQVTGNDEYIGMSDATEASYFGSTPVSFGFIPRYSEYKVQGNILNGDLSLRSKRSSYLAYTLDRFYQVDDVRATGTVVDGFTIQKVTRNEGIVSEELRYIGKYDAAGNFNRIFYNSGNLYDTRIFEGKSVTTDDNFIIHCKVQMKFIAPMLSMSDSFDTDADNEHGISVGHE